MLLLILFPFFQLLHGLDVSNLVPKTATDSSPCKSCRVLVQSFEKVMLFYTAILCLYGIQ